MRLSRKEREARKREKESEAAKRAAIEQQAAIQRAIGESGLHQYNTGKAELYEGKPKDGRAGKTVFTRVRNDPLREYYLARIITMQQLLAGKRLESLWLLAQPPGGISMERLGVRASNEPAQRILDAMQAYNAAMRSITDMLARSYVYSVCIEGHRVQSLRGIDNAKKPDVLRKGLDALADFLGY